MARERGNYRFFSCDFETTVYEGQTNTEVWASAVVEFNTEDVKIFHSIDETFSYFKSLKSNCVWYYHNLKFDGNFWISYLLNDLKFEQATIKNGSGVFDLKFVNPKFMLNNTFQYSISDMGQWYSIRVKVNDYMLEIRDSLKLLPFSVKEIGKAFGTKHQKLEMEYNGFRYAGCEITQSEQEYIGNDVLVVKEALEIMFAQGHNKLTIGACCLSEYKSEVGKKEYSLLFPNLTNIPIMAKEHGASNADEWIRHSYKGGWCYAVPEKTNKIYKQGTTADVNSLYPSMMSSESGNYYPVGKPHFWRGNTIPNVAKINYFFVRIKTRFYLKDDYLPFIQIKGSWLYKPTECLESTDITDRRTGKKSAYYLGADGEIKDTRVILTLTMTDYYLFLEHYNVCDFEILDGCYFDKQIGIFDNYIEKYKKQKLENTGALRTLAKLFLNNLYGKMASNTESDFKYAYVKEDKSIGFVTIQANEKESGYIAVGSAITSYARNFTIRAAQKNYYGKNKRGFIYADTDSIHCDLKPSEFKGISVHDKNFCCWKLESCWETAIFVRQKTYMERVIQENCEPCEPYWNIKCAGMPDKCKRLFEMSMNGYEPRTDDKFTQEELDFLKTKRTIKDFKVGLSVPGKLLPKRIEGGVLLVNTTFELRN